MYLVQTHRATERAPNIGGFLHSISNTVSSPDTVSPPQAQEASNLIVTSAISSSHIAYGSIRMEPVFMTMGQAGATAAMLAAERGISVQELDYGVLRERMIADGMLLEWPANLGEARRGAAEHGLCLHR